jgi:DNA-binding transcriptional LysR family regulator
MARQGGRSLDDLQSMMVFAQVVEARSFTAAARALDTTTSAVSKRVARLEERLGVRLMERTTRALAPTEAGRAFYERSARILREVEDAELAVTQLGSAPRGTLRVTALPPLGERLLAPLLPRLLEEYPELRVEIDLSDRLVNLVEDGYDVALRIMPFGLPDSSLIARKLGAGRAVVCGAPSYLERRGVPRTLDDLLDHECLSYGIGPAQREWSFPTADGTHAVPVHGRLQVNSFNALRAAAIGGAGLVRTALWAVSDAVQSGALQIVLEDHITMDLPIYAVYPAGKQLLPKVKVFVDFLLRELPAQIT